MMFRSVLAVGLLLMANVTVADELNLAVLDLPATDSGDKLDLSVLDMPMTSAPAGHLDLKVLDYIGKGDVPCACENCDCIDCRCAAKTPPKTTLEPVNKRLLTDSLLVPKTLVVPQSMPATASVTYPPWHRPGITYWHSTGEWKTVPQAGVVYQPPSFWPQTSSGRVCVNGQCR